jgi:hypothetical protein
MTKTKKPADSGNLSTGLKRGTATINLCLNPTTSSRTIQLFGTFDRDTKTAVIVTAREVHHE